MLLMRVTREGLIMIACTVVLVTSRKRAAATAYIHERIRHAVLWSSPLHIRNIRRSVGFLAVM